jgi:hypothetical protein
MHFRGIDDAASPMADDDLRILGALLRTELSVGESQGARPTIRDEWKTSDFAFNEMTLLKVLPQSGSAGAACFYASHDYSKGGTYYWLRPLSPIGNLVGGSLESISIDRVKISQVQAVNGSDWVAADFVWPVAEGEEELRAGCGEPPALHPAQAQAATARDSTDSSHSSSEPSATPSKRKVDR